MLLEIILEELNSFSEIAEVLGVSKWSVCKWFDPNMTHPSNSNTEKIINLAIKINRDKAKSLLLDEALEYLELVRFKFKQRSHRIPMRKVSENGGPGGI